MKIRSLFGNISAGIAFFLLGACFFSLAVQKIHASTISMTLQRPSNNLGLVAYWTFDGDSVTSGAGGVLDVSGNGHNGTLYGQAGGTTTVTTFASSGSFTWVAPAGIPGVTSATVELWGGGGAGGGVTAVANLKGGGAAGGQYAMSQLEVVPGQSYAVKVAATKAGTSGASGGNGNDSTFATTVVVAKGGAGGGGSSSGVPGAAGTGSTSGGVGDVVYAGGSGSAGIIGTCSALGGAGGGGAGSTGTGNDASGNTKGAAKNLNGGAGAAGKTSAGNGATGSTAGGAGGGACTTSSTARTGGTGAIGRAQITYASPQTMPVAVPARISQGLQFSGVPGGYVSAGDMGTNVMTVAFWMKAATSTASQRIFDLNGTATITLTSGTLSAGAGFTSPTIYVDDAVSSTIPDLNWHHVVVTTSTGVNASAVDIGRASAGYFGGSLDDVRLYSRAFGPADINDIYHVGATSHVSTSMIGGPTLASGLVGWWTFDGKTMTSNIGDSSTNANDGDLQLGASGSLATTTGPGKIGQAITLDGTDDNINAGSDANMDALADKTICAWISPDTTGKLASGSHYGVILSKANGSNLGWSLQVTDTDSSVASLAYSQTFSSGQGLWHTPASSLALGSWQHVCASYDDSSASNNPALYINGAAQTLTTVSSPSGTPDDDSSSDLIIGDVPSGILTYDGRIDNVRLYNRILSASEISRIYKLGQPTQVSTSLIGQGQLDSGLMGWWTFDGPYMIGNVADKSGNGNTGTLTGATTTVPGRIGQALKLSDQNAASPSYVTAPNTPSLSITTGTLAAWVKADSFGCPSTGTYCALITKDDGNDNQNGYEFDTRAGVLDLLLDGASSWQEATANTTMSDGVWYHVAVSWDGSTIRFYVNGQPDGTAVQTVVPVSNVYKLIIGGGQNASSAVTPTTNAAMDDVRVYNRVLSASDIQRLYGLGR